VCKGTRRVQRDQTSQTKRLHGAGETLGGEGEVTKEHPKRSQRVDGVSDESTGEILRDNVVRRMSPGTEEVRCNPRSMTMVIASVALQLMAACGEA